MPALEAFAAKLLSDLSALPEKRMRMGLFVKALSSVGPEDAARVVELVYSMGPEDRGAAIARSLMVDGDGLLSGLGDARHSAIYLAAVRLGLTRVARLFNDIPPHMEGPSGYEEEEFVKTSLMSLGERRALSRTAIMKNLERLLSDPDPVVIRNLLNNPRITEREVLKIASRRPNSAEVLKAVALHKKWSGRYAVAKALALNPYSPPRIAVAFLEMLLKQDLRLASEDQTIHPDVRDAAKEAFFKKEKG